MPAPRIQTSKVEEESDMVEIVEGVHSNVPNQLNAKLGLEIDHVLGRIDVYAVVNIGGDPLVKQFRVFLSPCFAARQSARASDPKRGNPPDRWLPGRRSSARPGALRPPDGQGQH